MVIVFEIEIDIFLFIAHLLWDKLKTAIGDTSKVLSQKVVNFIDIQSHI